MLAALARLGAHGRVRVREGRMEAARETGRPSLPHSKILKASNSSPVISG